MNEFSQLYNDYMKILSGDIREIGSGSVPINLPPISAKMVQKLCEKVKHFFAEEQSLLVLEGPWIVIGDIHGHILDLFQIISKFGPPNTHRYLFLGDLVDRGEFSIETVFFIFLIKCLFPQNIMIIRGNHEFEYMCTQCGFLTDMLEMYSDYSLFAKVMDTFNYISLGAIINNEYLCVHGGIGPDFTSLIQIRSIKRPLSDFGDRLIDGLLWSDPSTKITHFHPSGRGTGFLFGEIALTDFLQRTGIKALVRGHECVNEGVLVTMNGKCVTVFSASNYCGVAGNQSGVMEIVGPRECAFHQFPAIPYLKRPPKQIDFIPIRIQPTAHSAKPHPLPLAALTRKRSIGQMADIRKPSVQSGGRSHGIIPHLPSIDRMPFDWNLIK